jgi:hypothetical protein
MTNKTKRAPGAGRPRLDVDLTRRITVTLRPSDIAALRAIDPNLSKAIRTLVDRAAG